MQALCLPLLKTVRACKFYDNADVVENWNTATVNCLSILFLHTVATFVLHDSADQHSDVTYTQAATTKQKLRGGKNLISAITEYLIPVYFTVRI